VTRLQIGRSWVETPAGQETSLLLQNDKTGPGTHTAYSMGIREYSNAVKAAGE